MRLCRECREGKHRNCDGTAWGYETDAPAPCLCDDQQHVVEGLTGTPLDDHFETLRDAANTALAALVDLVLQACPGEHQTVQHRDRQPPWCRICGRDNSGVRRR